MNGRYKKYLFITVALIALVAVLALASGSVSADTHVWIGDAGDALATNSNNWHKMPDWEDEVPTDSDDLVWNASSTNKACTFNIARTFGTVTLTSGYTGIVTQGATVAFGYTDFSQNGGKWIGVTGYVQTCSGNYIVTGGTASNILLNLKMTGNGKYYNLSVAGSWNLYQLQVSGDITIGGANDRGVIATIIDSGKTLTISSGRLYYSLIAETSDYATWAWTNNGKCDGAGTLLIYQYRANANHVITFGDIRCGLIKLFQDDYAYKYSLGANAVVTSPITVSSGDPTDSMVVDLAGKTLQCGSLSIGIRGTVNSASSGSRIITTGGITVSAATGILTATNIAWIECGDTFDSSAGTWTPGINQVNMTSAYKSIKLATAQTFYNLQLVSNINVTGRASVTHLIKYNGLTANHNYLWKNATTIGTFTSNATGLIDISARWLYIANLYRMEITTWAPAFASSPVTSIGINQAYSYSITVNETSTVTALNLPAWLTLSNNGTTTSPWVLSGTATPIGVYNIKTKAVSSNGTLTAWQNFTVTVAGWASSFTNNPLTVAKPTVTYTYAATLNESCTVSMDTKPAWATLAGKTISGIPGVIGIYSFNMKAVSTNGSLSSWKNWTVTVTGWIPTYTSSPVLTGQVLIAYSYSITVNETATVTGLTIPAWLTLTHNGTATSPWVLGGTPTVAGVYSISTKAVSSNGTLTTWQNFSITVIGRWAPTYTSSPILTGTENIAYSYSLTVNETATVTAINIPSWLTLSHNGTTTSPWVLAGTPTVHGVYLIKIKGLSSAGLLYSYQNFSITIANTWAPTFTSSPVLTGIENVAYSYTITLNVTGTVTSLNVPSWLSIAAAKNGTTGPWVLTGTPTVHGVYVVNLRAYSAVGLLYSYQNFSITIANTWAPAFTSSPGTSGITFQVYSYTPTCNESVNLVVITKPAWATMAGGTLSGFSTVAGIFAFQLSATSIAGTLTASQYWNVTIIMVPATITSAAPSTSINEDHGYYYNATADQTGTWSIVTLHPWMTIGSGTGKVTGTPDNLDIASRTVSLRLTNINGTGYRNWTLIVVNVAVVFTSSPVTTGHEDGFYSYNAQSSDEGFGAVYSVTDSTGQLTVNPSSGVLSGTITGRTYLQINLTVNDGHGSIAFQNFTITVPTPGEEMWAISQMIVPIMFLVFVVLLICLVVFMIGGSFGRHGRG